MMDRTMEVLCLDPDVGQAGDLCILLNLMLVIVKDKPV